MRPTRPWVTQVLIGLTVAVFLLQAISQSLLDQDLPLALGAKIDDALRAGQLWRLLTPALLHGSLLHIGFNMLALHSLGPGLERHYGPGRFLALYLLAALGGNVLSFLLSPAVSVGASTAVYGLFAAEMAFVAQNRQLLGPAGSAALRQMWTLLGVNVLISFSPGIDLWGHLGGLLAGGAYAALAGPRLAWRAIDEERAILVDQRAPGRVRAAGLGLLVVLLSLAAYGIAR